MIQEERQQRSSYQVPISSLQGYSMHSYFYWIAKESLNCGEFVSSTNEDEKKGTHGPTYGVLVSNNFVFMNTFLKHLRKVLNA